MHPIDLSPWIIHLFTLICAVGIAFFLYIGWIDLITQKIRNKTLMYLLPISMIHLFMPAPIGAGTNIHLWGIALLQPLILFVLLFIGYTIKTMGAGDAKYGFVLGVWLSPHGIIEFITDAAILTLVVLTPLYIFQKVSNSDRYLAWASRFPKLLLIRNNRVFCAYGPFMSLAAIYITLKWLYAVHLGKTF